MKRREVLRNLGLGVTAGLALPWLSSCSEDENDPEVPYDGVVGIVGAGAAGLAVADYLLSKGIKVKIFEASGTIGGRITSVKQSDPIFNELIADFHVELGADRIIGKTSELANVAKLLKVPVIDFRNDPTNAMDHYIINNSYKSLSDIQSDPGLLADFNALLNFKNSTLPGYTGGGSVQDAAPPSEQMEGVLNSWLGNAYGSSADMIGANGLGEALALNDLPDKDELTLSINPMLNVISARFDNAVDKVQFNKAVTSVSYSGETISLTLKDTKDNSETTETVGKLIITVPVAVLKDSALINFDPPLPASKLDALSRIGMDASVRIILEFTRNDFFGTNPAVIFGGTECPSYFFTGAGRSNINRTLSLTINGPKGQELSGLSDDLKVERVLAELDSVFDGKASANVRRRFPERGGTIIYVVKDWTKEPYIKGGISYPLVGGTNDDRIALAEPVSQKLYFAGEATDVVGQFGTVSGALLSARRAAEEVIAAILEENAS